MNNADVRILIQANGLKYYEVARKAGYSETHFSRLLREELNPEARERVINAIEALVSEKNSK